MADRELCCLNVNICCFGALAWEDGLEAVGDSMCIRRSTCLSIPFPTERVSSKEVHRKEGEILWYSHVPTICLNICTLMYVQCDAVSFYPTTHSSLHNALQQQLKSRVLLELITASYLLVGHLISLPLWEPPCCKSTSGKQISSHVKKNPPHSSHWGRQRASLISATSKYISHTLHLYLIVLPVEINNKTCKDKK